MLKQEKEKLANIQQDICFFLFDERVPEMHEDAKIKIM